MIMKKIMILVVLALIMSVNAMAQRSSRRNSSVVNMAEIYNQQAEQLIKDIKVKKDKKDAFTALYLDYQNARFAAANPAGNDQARVDEKELKEVTEENADSLFTVRLERQVKQMEVDKEYYAKFKDLLTASQAAKVFLQPSATSMMSSMGAMMSGMMGGFGGMMGGFGGGMPMGGGGMPMGGGGMPMGGMGF